MDFLTANDVAKLIGMSRSSVWRLAEAGIIPKPKKMGIKKRHWLKTEIDDYLQRVIAA